MPGRRARLLVALRRAAADAGPALKSAGQALKAAGERALQWSRSRAGPRDRPVVTPSTSATSLPAAARALPVAAAALAAGASAAGVSRPGLYRDERSVVEMLRGYDAVTLTLAAPALVGAARSAGRGSARGQLVLAGLLAYLVYAYAVFVFGTAFNAAFLAHVAILALSLTALAVLLLALDVPWIGERMRPGTPARPVAGLLGALGVTLGSMWAYNSVRFALTGRRPSESKLVLPLPMVRLGYVLDLLLVVPEYLAAARLLWRRAPWGYVLATVLLTSGTLLQLQYMTALVLQHAARVPGSTPYDPVEPFIALGMAAGAAALLSRVRRGTPGSGLPRR